MSLFRADSTASEREKGLEILREAAAKSTNVATAKAREAFLDLSDDMALMFVNQIDVIDNHPNLTDVTSEIEGEVVLVAPSHKQQAAEFLEGWWLGVVGRWLGQ